MVKTNQSDDTKTVQQEKTHFQVSLPQNKVLISAVLKKYELLPQQEYFPAWVENTLWFNAHLTAHAACLSCISQVLIRKTVSVNFGKRKLHISTIKR